MQSKTVTVGDFSIHYLEFGKKDKPSLLLLHGFHGTSSSYITLSAYLSQNFHVYTPDLPGFGKSDGLKNGFRISKAAFTMVKFTKKLKLKKFYLCGASMSGAVALEMIPHVEKNLRGLILLSPLFSNKHFKLGKKKLFLKALIKFGKIPPVYHILAPKLMKNDTFVKYLLRIFSTSPGVSNKDLKERVENTRTCDCQTYIDGLDDILNYEARIDKIFSQVKTAIILNPDDELIDPQKTYDGYKTIFPKSKYIKIAIDNHNPIVKPDVMNISWKYSYLIEKILCIFK